MGIHTYMTIRSLGRFRVNLFFLLQRVFGRERRVVREDGFIENYEMVVEGLEHSLCTINIRNNAPLIDAFLYGPAALEWEPVIELHSL